MPPAVEFKPAADDEDDDADARTARACIRGLRREDAWTLADAACPSLADETTACMVPSGADGVERCRDWRVCHR